MELKEETRVNSNRKLEVKVKFKGRGDQHGGKKSPYVNSHRCHVPAYNGAGDGPAGNGTTDCQSRDGRVVLAKRKEVVDEAMV